MPATRSLPRIRMTPRRLYQLIDRRYTPYLFDEVARRAPRLAELRPYRRRVWVASEPELARHILVEAGRSVTKGEALRLIRIMLGDGLLTVTDVDLHRRHRRLVQPAFNPDRMPGYAAVMVEEAAATSARWAAQAWSTVDVAEEMAALTLAIVGRTLLGEDTAKDTAAITQAMDVVLRNFALGFLPGMMRLMRTNLPLAVRIRDAITSTDRIVRRLIAERRTHAPGPDVISTLLATQGTDDALDDTQIRDEVMTLLLAGHETTAMTLTWAWWLLDRNPSAAAALRHELHSVLGSADVGSTDVGYADLPRLPYTTAVVAETLRLRPPAWMIEREVAGEGFSLDGHIAPPGTTLLTSPWVLHRDRRYWTDPLAFVPERWLSPDGSFDDTAPGQPRGAYFAFGAGSRVCIGASFAWTEAVLALATLARQWAPALDASARVALRAAVTLRPAYGMQMRLEPAKVPVAPSRH